MEGFQLTFDQLYGGDGGSGEGSSSAGTNLSGSSGAGNRTCGSGNGASSDILIVSEGTKSAWGLLEYLAFTHSKFAYFRDNLYREWL